MLDAINPATNLINLEPKSRYSNWLIEKLINIFADVEERKEREKRA